MLLVWLAACDTGLESVSGPAPRPCADPVASDFASLRDGLFRGCAQTSACHGARAAGGLDLRPEVAYDTLVGVAAQGDPSRLRVAPFDPDGSYLVHLLGDGAPPAERMPPAAPVCAAELEAVRAWITMGAPPASD